MLSTIGIKVDTSDLVNADGKLQNLENALGRLATAGSNKALGSGRSSGKLKFKFRANATRKMKNVVLAIAEEIGRHLNSYTIMGDAGKLKQGSATYSFQYAKLYQKREHRYGIEQEVGFHKGAYVYTESIRGLSNQTEVRDLNEMMSDIKSDFRVNYTLGDTFYIGASGPAYKYFEKGVIGQPVLQPTLRSVMLIYRAVAEAAYARRAY